MNIHIEGRRWRDRYGNTYHRVRIYRGGTQTNRSGIVYGYGDHYLDTAIALLGLGGIRRNLGLGPSEYCREELGASYSVVDVARKGDL